MHLSPDFAFLNSRVLGIPPSNSQFIDARCCPWMFAPQTKFSRFAAVWSENLRNFLFQDFAFSRIESLKSGPNEPNGNLSNPWDSKSSNLIVEIFRTESSVCLKLRTTGRLYVLDAMQQVFWGRPQQTPG